MAPSVIAWDMVCGSNSCDMLPCNVVAIDSTPLVLRNLHASPIPFLTTFAEKFSSLPSPNTNMRSGPTLLKVCIRVQKFFP